MPCYTIQAARVDLGKAAQAGPLNIMAALNAMGAQNVNQAGQFIRWSQGWLNVVTGEAYFRGSMDADQLRQAIGKEVVRSQAKRFGWSVKEESNGKLTVMKAKF